MTDQQRPAAAGPEIENLMAEGRTFPPDPAFSAQANAGPDLYARADADFEAFWAELAREKLRWQRAVRHDADLGAALRPLVRGRPAQRLGELPRPARRGRPRRQGRLPLDRRAGRHAYAHLRRPPSRGPEGRQRPPGARACGRGDRVAIYMPMIPELPIAMLACARIGAPHTVVFGGFSAEALASRIDDAQATLLITADGGWRRGRPVDLKSAADEALERTSTVEHVLVVRRIGDALPVAMQEGRDVWWHDIVDRQDADCPPVAARRRAHAVPALHVGHDRQAQGHHAHLGGLPARRRRHPRDGLRHQARRRLLVRRRHRLGDRALVHRLRPARQRHDGGALRGRSRHAIVGALVADRRGVPGQRPVHGAHGHPRLHEAGRGACRRDTTSRRCGCWAASASPSTPRPGCGTASMSAAAAAPSSTRGGRPRPATSSSRRCPVSRPPSRAAPRSPSRASRPTSSMPRAIRCPWARAATSS